MNVVYGLYFSLILAMLLFFVIQALRMSLSKAFICEYLKIHSSVIIRIPESKGKQQARCKKCGRFVKLFSNGRWI